jgi:hypothetical protein
MKRLKRLLAIVVPLLLFMTLYGLRGGSQAHRRAVEEDAAAATVLLIGPRLLSEFHEGTSTLYVGFSDPGDPRQRPLRNTWRDPSDAFMARFRHAPFTVKKVSERPRTEWHGVLLLYPRWRTNALVSVHATFLGTFYTRSFDWGRAWFPWPHGAWHLIRRDGHP